MTGTGIALRLERRFDAPRERVFDAWTNPEVLRKWWAAAAGWTGADAEVDLREGGRYRLAMRDGASGAVHAVTGTYLEVRPPERLAYTWTWEGEPEIMRGSERTHVVVEFLEEAEGTRVVLAHRAFAAEPVRDLHAEGWSACLGNLEARVLGGGGER